jgi:hypothetical protein
MPWKSSVSSVPSVRAMQFGDWTSAQSMKHGGAQGAGRRTDCAGVRSWYILLPSPHVSLPARTQSSP